MYPPFFDVQNKSFLLMLFIIASSSNGLISGKHRAVLQPSRANGKCVRRYWCVLLRRWLDGMVRRVVNMSSLFQLMRMKWETYHPSKSQKFLEPLKKYPCPTIKTGQEYTPQNTLYIFQTFRLCDPPWTKRWIAGSRLLAELPDTLGRNAGVVSGSSQCVTQIVSHCTL